MQEAKVRVDGKEIKITFEASAEVGEMAPEVVAQGFIPFRVNVPKSESDKIDLNREAALDKIAPAVADQIIAPLMKLEGQA